VERPGLALAGMSFFGDPFTSHAGWTEENEIGRLWARLIAFVCADDVPFPMPTVTWELHVRGAQALETGEFEVFAGFEAPDTDALPVELSRKTVPGGLHVEVELTVADMAADNPVLERWLRATGHHDSGQYVLLRYDERFRGTAGDSVLRLYVPVTSGTDESA
jgi:predicted transcriptional regulator YdeE